MKKSIFIFFAVMAFVSCRKESPVALQDNLKFTAGISSDVFRTNMTIDGTKGKIAWESGDKITVRDAAGSSAVYVAEAAGNPTTFVLKEGETALGAGPYSATYLSGEARKDQTYYSDKVPSVAMRAPETESTELTFTASCGVLKLNVKGEGITVKRIMMKGDNTDLYTLDCGAGVDITAGVDFYIALKQESYKKIYFTNTDDKTCIRTFRSGKEVGILDNVIQPITMPPMADADFDCIYLGSRVGGDPNGYLVCWAECNIGATKPEEAGYYFRWGETTGYKRVGSNWYPEGDTSQSAVPFTAPTTATEITPENDAAHVILGGSWRMPLKSEFSKLIKYSSATPPFTYCENYQETGVKGVEITGNTGAKIFLPEVGFGKDTKCNTSSAGVCFYWMNAGMENGKPYGAQIGPVVKNSKEELVYYKEYQATGSYGFPIRPVKD